MDTILQTIVETPFYVWAILAYILSIGIKSFKTHVVYLPKLFIIPVVFLYINYKTMIFDGILVFCIIIIIAAILSFVLYSQNIIELAKRPWSIKIPGNYITLAILMSFFIFKYYFGYLNSTAPDLFIKYSTVNIVVSAIFSGYYIGRVLCYTYQYLKIRKK